MEVILFFETDDQNHGDNKYFIHGCPDDILRSEGYTIRVHGKTHGSHPMEDKMRPSSALIDTLIAYVQLLQSIVQVFKW